MLKVCFVCGICKVFGKNLQSPMADTRFCRFAISYLNEENTFAGESESMKRMRRENKKGSSIDSQTPNVDARDDEDRPMSKERYNQRHKH